MSVLDTFRRNSFPDPDFTVPVGPHRCPECGTSSGVYVRSGAELVCTVCRDAGFPSSSRPGETVKDRP